jgi:protein TonB
MTGRLNLVWGYGPLELKRCYQKNLGWGITLAGLLHIIVIGGLLIYSNLTTKPPKPPIIIVITDPAKLTPPPPIGRQQMSQTPIAIQTEVIKEITKSMGIPNPVPDKEAPEDATILSQKQLDQMGIVTAGDVTLGSGDTIVFRPDQQEVFPQPGEFVPHQEEPVSINQLKPEYPPLAMQAGIEGEVKLLILVDKNGNVRDVKVVKPSGCSAGFEEAAIKAAYQTKWQPAISNGQPVAVWVGYPVRFVLK